MKLSFILSFLKSLSVRLGFLLFLLSFSYSSYGQVDPFEGQDFSFLREFFDEHGNFLFANTETNKHIEALNEKKKLYQDLEKKITDLNTKTDLKTEEEIEKLKLTQELTDLRKSMKHKLKKLLKIMNLRSIDKKNLDTILEKEILQSELEKPFNEKDSLISAEELKKRLQIYSHFFTESEVTNNLVNTHIWNLSEMRNRYVELEEKIQNLENKTFGGTLSSSEKKELSDLKTEKKKLNQSLKEELRHLLSAMDFKEAISQEKLNEILRNEILRVELEKQTSEGLGEQARLVWHVISSGELRKNLSYYFSIQSQIDNQVKKINTQKTQYVKTIELIRQLEDKGSKISSEEKESLIDLKKERKALRKAMKEGVKELLVTLNFKQTPSPQKMDSMLDKEILNSEFRPSSREEIETRFSKYFDSKDFKEYSEALLRNKQFLLDTEKKIKDLEDKQSRNVLSSEGKKNLGYLKQERENLRNLLRIEMKGLLKVLGLPNPINSKRLGEILEREILRPNVGSSFSATNDGETRARWKSNLSEKELERALGKYFPDSNPHKKAIEILKKLSFWNEEPLEIIRKTKLYAELKEKQKTLEGLSVEEDKTLRKLEQEKVANMAIAGAGMKKLGAKIPKPFLMAFVDSLKEHAISGQKLEHFELEKMATSFKSITETKTFEQVSHQAKLGPMIGSFPMQMMGFALATGAALQRISLTDPWIYGADRTPGQGAQAFWQQLTPEGMISFFAFIAISNVTSKRVLALGQKIDGAKMSGKRRFTGRFLKDWHSSAGLGTGFFVSALMHEMIIDPSIQKCVGPWFKSTIDNIKSITDIKSITGNIKSLLKPEKKDISEVSIDEMIETIDVENIEDFEAILAEIENLNFSKGEMKDYLGPCEEAQLKWFSLGKWIQYGVDIGVLLSASWVNHKGLQGAGWLATKSFILAKNSRLMGSMTRMASHTVLFAKNQKMVSNTLATKPVQGMKSLSKKAASGMAPHMGTVGKIGGFITRNTMFGFTLYTFMEVIHVLEAKFGKRIKKSFVGGKLVSQMNLGQKMTFDALSYLEKPPYELIIDEKDRLSFLNQSGFDDPTAEALDLIERERFSDADYEVFSISNILDHSILTKKYKKIGNDMQAWNLLLTTEQLQSFQLWLDKLNNFYQPYAGYKQLLKALYKDSKKSFAEDFVLTDSFRSQYKDLKLRYCEENADMILEEDLILWIEICDGEHPLRLDNTNSEMFKEETMRLIISYLEKILQRIESRNWGLLSRRFIDENNFLNYLSEKEDELFSSDPDFSLINFFSIPGPLNSQSDFKNLFQLSNLLLKESLNSKSGIHSSQKLRVAGLRVLEKLARKMPALENYDPKLNTMAYHYLIPLVSLFKAYKKGEVNFSNAEEIFFSRIGDKESFTGIELKSFEKEFKRTEDPYSFLMQSICGIQMFDFEVPPVFENVDIEIYRGGSQYQDIEPFCALFKKTENPVGKFITKFMKNAFYLSIGPPQLISSRMHTLLFELPVRMKPSNASSKIKEERRFENLYLALEDYWSKHFASEELLDKHWEERSKEQLITKGEVLLTNLGLVTKNYYREVVGQSYKAENNIIHHYSPIDFNDGNFKPLTSFQGLEGDIYQVNYWLETLKEALKRGDKIKAKIANTEETMKLNDLYSGVEEEGEEGQEGFNESEFNKMQKEVISFLQDYNESGKREEGPYVRPLSQDYLKSLEAIFDEDCFITKKSRFSLILSDYKSLESTPPLLSANLVLAHVLAHSIPILHSESVLTNFIGNKISASSPWKELIDTILFELNRSLNNFFSNLQPLALKDKTEASKNKVKALENKHEKEEECVKANQEAEDRPYEPYLGDEDFNFDDDFDFDDDFGFDDESTDE